MPQTAVKHFIVGGGSIGLLWASWIRQTYPKYPICLLLRKRNEKQDGQQQDSSSRELNVILRRSENVINEIKQQQLVWQQNPVPKAQYDTQLTDESTDERCSTENTVGRRIQHHFVIGDSDGMCNQNDICFLNMSDFHRQPLSKNSEQEENRVYCEDVCVSIPYEFITRTNKVEITKAQIPIETLIVATKSYQAKNAVESLLYRFSTTATTITPHVNRLRIIVLCNGAFAVREELTQLFVETAKKTAMQMPLIYVATTTHGAYRIVEHQQTVVVHAGYGQTFLEENQEDDDPQIINGIQQLWKDCSLNCSRVISRQEMNEELWNKLAVNCIINPLSVMNNCCTNGQIVNAPNYSTISKGVLHEIATVYYYSTLNITTLTQRNNELGERAQAEEDHNAKILKIVKSMEQYVAIVLKQTAKNYSSMVQDIQALSSFSSTLDSNLDSKNVPKTEIQYLNGYIVQKGQRYNIKCPMNQYLLESILQIEQQAQ
jgi:2-dehydropantoate 2-reductase